MSHYFFKFGALFTFVLAVQMLVEYSVFSSNIFKPKTGLKKLSYICKNSIIFADNLKNFLLSILSLSLALISIAILFIELKDIGPLSLGFSDWNIVEDNLFILFSLIFLQPFINFIQRISSSLHRINHEEEIFCLFFRSLFVFLILLTFLIDSEIFSLTELIRKQNGVWLNYIPHYGALLNPLGFIIYITFMIDCYKEDELSVLNIWPIKSVLLFTGAILFLNGFKEMIFIESIKNTSILSEVYILFCLVIKIFILNYFIKTLSKNISFIRNEMRIKYLRSLILPLFIGYMILKKLDIF